MKLIGIVFACFICVVILLALLTDFDRNDRQLQAEFDEFSKILQQDTEEELSLTIYYIDPSILTRFPLKIEDLVQCSDVQKIYVNSEQLTACWDVLKQLNAENITRVKEPSYLDARMCYIFETERNGKVLEVAFGGNNQSVFINGIEVYNNHIFRDILELYVTESTMEQLECLFPVQ